MVFTVDPNQSTLTISGVVGETSFSGQASNALATTYSGTVNASLTPTNIQFTGSSSIGAATSGNWQPAPGGVPGSAPADYGVTNSVNVNIGYPPNFVPGNAAFRDIVLDVTNSGTSLTNGDFDGNTLAFTLVTNAATLDFYYPYSQGSFSGSAGLSASATNTLVNGASLTTNGPVISLVIPVNVTFEFPSISINGTTFTLMGQLVATNMTMVTPPPIIQFITVSNLTAVITTTNTFGTSLLQTSQSLQSWTNAAAVVATNAQGSITFTTPLAGNKGFYRVVQ